MMDRKSFGLGARHMLPLMLGGIPFGMVIGLAIAESARVPDWAGFLSGPLIVGGASQLAAITLLAEGAGPWAAIAAALVVNLRHVMYSAGLVPWFQQQPAWFRWFGPYLMVDQVFALTSVRHDDEPRQWRSYYLGAGATAWSLFLGAMAVGIVAGAAVPDDLRLEFGIPLLFIGLFVPTLSRRPAAVGALAAVFVTGALAGLPNRFGMLIGAAVGIGCATLVDRDPVA